MSLESANKISNLVKTNPASTDPVSEGDNHIRLIKTVLQSSFPSDLDVQVPNAADQEGKYLHVNAEDGTIEWKNLPVEDIAESLSIVGYIQRPRFEYAGGTEMIINPGAYHVNGIPGLVEWREAITIPVVGNVTGSLPVGETSSYLYLYINQSHFAITSGASAYSRVIVDQEEVDSSSDKPFYFSLTPPTYNPELRGWYLDGNDRCIFFCGGASDTGTGWFKHDGDRYIASPEDFNEYSATPASADGSWSTAALRRVSPICDTVQLTFQSQAASGVSALWKHYQEDVDGKYYGHNGHKFALGPGVSTFVLDVTERTLMVATRSGTGKIDLYVNGQFLPNGM